MAIANKIQILNGYEGREVAFVEEVLIPVFRGMGFSCNFNHGAYELGKDILLRKNNDFSIPKYTAIVAKVGDIGNTNSRARGTLSEVERQVDQAWSTPFISAEWREKDKWYSPEKTDTRFHAAFASCSNCIGVMKPMLECNLSRL